MSQQTITIDGMSCGHCVARVRKALEGVAGVNVTHVGIGEARIEAQPGPAVEETLRRVLNDAGYRVIEVKSS